MNRLKSWSAYVLAYAMWIVSFLLWLGFMILGRKALNGILGLYYINDIFNRMKQAQFIDRAFVFLTGLVWVIIMIVVENYFRRGVKKGDLWQRIGRVLGVQVLFIFVADAAAVFFVDPTPTPWFRWVLLVVEVVIGVGALWLASRPVRPAAPAAQGG